VRLSDSANSGIFVSEGLSRGQAIAVRRATVAAFIGSTARGPVGIPIAIKSVAEYLQRFGSPDHPNRIQSLLQQFFDNEGTTAIIVRVCSREYYTRLALPGPAGDLVLKAINPGSLEFLRASIDYDGIPDTDETGFNLAIHRLTSRERPMLEEQELFKNLSIDPTDPDYVGHALISSNLVQVEGELPAERPSCSLIRGIEVGKSYIYADNDGQEPELLNDYDLIGCDTECTGLYALNQVSVVDLVCLVPDVADVGPVAFFAAERYCRSRNMLLLMDPPSHWESVTDAINSLRQHGSSSPNVVTYFPRPAPVAGDNVDAYQSALGAIAGRIAADDGEFGIREIADDKTDYLLRGRSRLAVTLTDEDQDMLIRMGVNPLQSVRTGRCRMRGLVTFAQGEGAFVEWNDLRKRRAALFVLESIVRGTRWTAYQDDGSETWPTVRKQVIDFLSQVFDNEKRAGHTDDYFVTRQSCSSGMQGNEAPGGLAFTVGFAFGGKGSLIFRLTQEADGCVIREIGRQAPVALAG
jgi:hypothetical protein